MNKQRITGARLLACTAAVLAVIGSSLVGAGRGGPGGRGGGAPQGDPAAAPTPRLASGKPDLTGSWGGGGWNLTGSGAPGATVGGMFRRCTPFQAKTCMEWTNQSQDWVFMSTARLDMRLPIYKPEHWDKMIEMDQWSNRDDPVMTCLPLGIPRQGAPARIFHTDTDITMLYRGGSDGAGGYAEHRMVAIDGKPHDPRAGRKLHLHGVHGGQVGRRHARPRLDRISDETWLARGGYFHSDQMRVVEKFTRTGNQLLYEVTVEDPEVLVEPWVMPTRRLVLRRQQRDHRRARKLHGERAQGSRHADAALRRACCELALQSAYVLGLNRRRGLRESPSVWAHPTVLTLHTMGMAVLVGASWVLDLRLLGISPQHPAVRLPLGLSAPSRSA